MWFADAGLHLGPRMAWRSQSLQEKGPALPRGPDIRDSEDYWFGAPFPRPPAPPPGPFALLRCTSGSSGGCGPITLVSARQAQISSLQIGTRGAEPPTPMAPIS